MLLVFHTVGAGETYDQNKVTLTRAVFSNSSVLGRKKKCL